MLRIDIVRLALLLGALNLGCSKEEAVRQTPPPAATEASKPGNDLHAAADVKAGSHEDWCVEHGVPESQCTRCNPSLAAAFKATGDWCAEHGLPESQCLQCNPDLKIVRPPKTN
jgi:hypothetical protein